MKQLQHFYHPEHPLVFNEDRIYGEYCRGCWEPILGPSYSCKECGGGWVQHKSCVELPLGLLHHYILFFSLTKLILKSTKILAIAKFAKKNVGNIVMVVSVAILSFTLDVVL